MDEYILMARQSNRRRTIPWENFSRGRCATKRSRRRCPSHRNQCYSDSPCLGGQGFPCRLEIQTSRGLAKESSKLAFRLLVASVARPLSCRARALRFLYPRLQRRASGARVETPHDDSELGFWSRCRISLGEYWSGWASGATLGVDK